MALTDQQLALEAGVPALVISAIRSIESAGRVSAIRFEPHVFHALTGTGSCLPKAGGSRCTAQQIIDQIRHTSIPYSPRDGKVTDGTSANTNAAAFQRAYAIDPDAAVRSTSFGLYQVLGGKGIAVYGSKEAFLREFADHPLDTSQRIFIRWFRDDTRARTAANTGDWATLARRYNNSGPGGDWYNNFTAALARLSPATVATAAAGGGILILGVAVGIGAYLYARGRRR